MVERTFAEVFPPGVFIKEELEARNWSQAELAEIIGRYSGEISDLISGKRGITPEIAKALGSAFGTSAQYWMNLEASYRLHHANGTDADVIARRARLYERAPIRDMVKRNWLETSENIDVLEQRVKRFFGITDLDEKVEFKCAARRGTQEITPSHLAWLCRARQLALAVHAQPFNERSLRDSLAELKCLLSNAEGIRQVPKVLADAGIRFLVVEALPKTRIDGVTFWLDAKSPVIVLTLRYDRIDWFWFTLAHEIGHVIRRDGLKSKVMIDTDLVGENNIPATEESDAEREASEFATNYLVSTSEMDSFIARVSPLYSKVRVAAFAKRVGVHPGIVVGQLHHRGELSYSSHRQLLDKVKSTVTQSALTDGWGDAPYVRI